MPFKFNPFTKKLDYYPKLDDCSAPDDNLDLNASASKHGLLLKLDDDTGKWLRSDGAWQAIPNLDTLTDDSMADSLHRHSELSASDGTPDSVVRVDSNGNISFGTDGGEDVIYLSRHSDASNYVDLQAGTADENKGVGFLISYRSANGTSRSGVYLSDTGVFSVAGNTVVDEATTNYVTLTDNSIANTLHRHSELVASDGSPDPALSVDNTGKVGIGTADPGAKLEISGEAEGIRITGTGTTGDASLGYLTFYDSNGTTRRGFIGDASSNNDDIYLQAETGDLHLGDSSGALVMNFNSGNVGIGETTPAAKLDVNGNLILQNGTSINEFSTDDTLGGDSDDAVPTEQAVKAYVDGHAPSAHVHDGDTLQLDGINSNGGTFAFTTSGAITFSQSLIVDGGDIGITADTNLIQLAANVLTVNGKLIVEKDTGGTYDSTTVAAIFGDSDANDSLYIIGNTIQSAYGADFVASMWINYRGYQAGSTQFRNLTIGDGKAAAVAIWTGASKLTDLKGNLLVNGGDIGTTADPNLLSLAANALTVNGTIAAHTGSTIGTTVIYDAQVQVNLNGSGNRYAHLNLIGDDTYTVYGLRLIRNNTGANATSTLVHRGTGNLNFVTDEAANILFQTNSVTRMTIAATGEITMPTQPAFSVVLGGDQTDIAVGSPVTVVFGSEIYDQGNDFNTGTYTFTAPVTGKYHFDVTLHLQDLDTLGNGYTLTLSTSNRNYIVDITTAQFAADLSDWYLSLSTDADMDANDIANVKITQGAGTQQTDIIDVGKRTFFTGHLVA